MLADITPHNKENVRCSIQTRRRRRAAVGTTAKPAGPGKVTSRRARLHHSVKPVAPRLALPRRLPRPHYNPVDPSNIAALSPSLTDVPLQYIRDKLRLAGSELLKAVAGAKPILPALGLPNEVEVQIRDMSATLPTHIFAVHSSQRAPIGNKPVIMFPVHDIVFTAMTSKVKGLPVDVKQTTESSITIPVVPLCIPSPQTFALLQSYLYTQRTDILLITLLPILSMPSFVDRARPALDQLPPKLATTYTFQGLLEQAGRVHGLWRNALALGVDDEKFWTTLETAWEVIFNALAIQMKA